MTTDEAIEAGLLVEAYRRTDELIAEAAAEATAPIEPPQTRFKTLCVELWGRDHEGDNNHAQVGPTLALPPRFATHILRVLKGEIESRLAALRVEGT